MAPDTNAPIPRQTMIRDLYSSKFTNLKGAISVKSVIDLLDTVLTAAMQMAVSLGREGDMVRARLDALEARPGLADAYKEVWRQDVRYTPGQMVTFSGSLWVAKGASVSRRPGGPDGVWQLAVKRGSDGKDCECPHCREATGATS